MDFPEYVYILKCLKVREIDVEIVKASFTLSQNSCNIGIAPKRGKLTVELWHCIAGR